MNWNFSVLHAGITLKCVGPSMGEKQPLTKKLPPATTVSASYHLSILIFGSLWHLFVLLTVMTDRLSNLPFGNIPKLGCQYIFASIVFLSWLQNALSHSMF